MLIIWPTVGRFMIHFKFVCLMVQLLLVGWSTCWSDEQLFFGQMVYLLVRWSTFVVWMNNRVNLSQTSSLKIVHPTNKSWPSDSQKLTIRSTKVDHPNNKSWPSEQQKVFIPPTKVDHPTNKSCSSDLQKLTIWPTNVVHPTYKSFF